MCSFLLYPYVCGKIIPCIVMLFGESMIKIENSVHGVPTIIVWYADKEISDKGIITYREALKPIGDAVVFDTLISNLEEEDEIIKSHFTKGCKYKVNRAYRENVTISMCDSQTISDEDITGFVTFFKNFWESKDVAFSEEEALIQEMKGYRNAGALALTKASIDDELAVYHTYIVGDDVARLYQSASLYRLTNDDEGSKKNVIGMANRMLHYEDMLYFKRMGIKQYDWGGAGKTEDVASITAFKESFGGEPRQYYDCRQVNGIKAKLVVAISALKSRIKG